MKKNKFKIIAILSMVAALSFMCACGSTNGMGQSQITDEISSPSVSDSSSSEDSPSNENSSSNEDSSSNENSSSNDDSSSNENSSSNDDNSNNEDGSSGGDLDLPFVPFCN